MWLPIEHSPQTPAQPEEARSIDHQTQRSLPHQGRPSLNQLNVHVLAAYLPTSRI